MSVIARGYFIICELQNYLTRERTPTESRPENCSGFLFLFHFSTGRAHSLLRHAPASGLTLVKIYTTGCDTAAERTKGIFKWKCLSARQLMSPGYRALANVTAFLFSTWIANYIKLPALKKITLTREGALRDLHNAGKCRVVLPISSFLSSPLLLLLGRIRL